jgi:hypothetical protein
MYSIYFDSKSSLVSPQSIHPLVVEVVMAMQYLANTTPLLGGDETSYHVVSQPFQ